MILGRIRLDHKIAAEVFEGNVAELRCLGLEDFGGSHNGVAAPIFRHCAPGDLLWVQEPVMQLQAKRDQTRFGISYGVCWHHSGFPGVVAGQPLNITQLPAERMPKGYSRMVLEVTTYNRPAPDRINIKFKVHQANISEMETAKGGAR